jgi:hypothetical protein
MLRGDVVGPGGLSAEYAVSQLNVAAFLVLAGHRLLRLEPLAMVAAFANSFSSAMAASRKIGCGTTRGR